MPEHNTQKINMMAGKKGYRNIISFSDDNNMLPDYYGIIARGSKFYMSHFININEGKLNINEISKTVVDKAIAHFKRFGMSIEFIEEYIDGYAY